MLLYLLKPIFGKNEMKKYLSSFGYWLKQQYANYKLFRAIKIKKKFESFLVQVELYMMGS